MAHRSLLTSIFSYLLAVVALSSRAMSDGKPFSCTGGAVYFSAHPVDGLLYQNPNLLHDLYVFKCVTSVVMTAGDRGLGSNFSQSLERGIQESYALMANLPVDNPAREEMMVRIGTHDVHSWSLKGMRNIQIVYLRLPDGSPSGHGYESTRGESLSKLYQREIDSITSIDGKSTYTLRDIKELIAFLLHERKPNFVHILNHIAKISDKDATPSDHTDHIVSAKLVRSIVAAEKINTTVKSYAANNVRSFEANINSSTREFARKSAAFFKYAAFDDHVCQSLKQCEDEQVETFSDDDVRYVAQYLRREYNVL